MRQTLGKQGNLLNRPGIEEHPQQAEFLLLRLLVSHYHQSLDGSTIFQDIYGYLPQNNLEQAIAHNLAGIRTKYFLEPEPEFSDLRGFGLMGIYLLTTVLPGQLRLDRDTRDILWYEYTTGLDSDLVDLIDLALYCSRNNRFPTGQHILNALQQRLKTQQPVATPAFPLTPSSADAVPSNRAKSPTRATSYPWVKMLICGNLLVGASIALGLVIPKQIWQISSIDPQTPDPNLDSNPDLNFPADSTPEPSSSSNSDSTANPNPASFWQLPSLSIFPQAPPITGNNGDSSTDPAFDRAIATARQAVTLGKNLPQQRNWTEVTPLWQQAIQQMQAIPPNSPKYSIAQEKVKEYQGYLRQIQENFDPFLLGMQQAKQAVAVGKSAQTPPQWQQAQALWQQAIQQMQAVPKDHSNYQTAQGKIKEYQRYQAAVQAKISNPSNSQKLTLLKVIEGDISPKSIVHSGNGLFFAQNMMYRHSITVYNRTFQLVKTIKDRVKLTDFGHSNHPGFFQGSPVEAAFSHQGRYAWVSNYEMSGAGFNNPGQDICNPKGNYDPSFVYRVDTQSLQIDRAIKVGSVPKYTAVSPDDRYLLVTNWCSWDLSIIDTQTSQEVQRLSLGAYPRGIAIDSKSQKAYIAIMGSLDLVVLNLQDLSLGRLSGMGNAPRHVQISPDDQYLYVSFNGEAQVGKIDLNTGKVLKKISTGKAPRSMVLSADGEFLYVVNYDSQSFSKVRAADMAIVETVRVAADPIGITYDAETRQVWVACYSGSIWVFQD
jgi:YVTN family beta-propeller protein